MARPIAPATLHRIYGDSPWSDPHISCPDILEALARNEQRLRRKPSWFAMLAADAREFCSEVADALAHHALFGVLVVLSWTVLLLAPIVIGSSL